MLQWIKDLAKAGAAVIVVYGLFLLYCALLGGG